MDSSSSEAGHDFSPKMEVYKDDRVERLKETDLVPPSFDPKTNVESKDVVISKDAAISARLFIPKITDPNRKFPLLVYFHGGGFSFETPFNQLYHNYLNSIVSEANIISVSVDYRKAPEHPVPIPHEDSWTAIQWVASHFGGNGPDEWLNCHADLEKVFFAGDSAGGNIAHHMAIRAGTEGLGGIKLEGVALIHPFFWGTEPLGSEKREPGEKAIGDHLWSFVCPTTTGSDDPMINPAKDPNVGRLGCKRVLVFVAEEDELKDRGWYYTKKWWRRVGGVGLWRWWKQKERAMCFICSTQAVRMLWRCVIAWFPSSTGIELGVIAVTSVR